jgi:hypothetical protein
MTETSLSSSLRRRKRNPQEGLEHPRQQLYRTNDSIQEAMELLAKEALTHEEIRDFCCPSSSSTSTRSGTTNVDGEETSDAVSAAQTTALSPPSCTTRGAHQAETIRSFDRSPEGRLAYEERVKLYRSRRIEIQQLLRKVRTGHARVDEDGRLVPVPEDADVDNHQRAASAPPNIQLPRPPPPPAPLRNNNINNLDLLANNLLLLNEEDNNDRQHHHRQWIQQEQREAAAAIERAVERYRNQQGMMVDMDNDLLLVRVRPHMAEERINLTFRRIGLAILAIVTSIVCIMIQHLPLYYSFTTLTDNSNSIIFSRRSNYNNRRSKTNRAAAAAAGPPSPSVDRLMLELLHVKLLEEHDQHCLEFSRENNLLLPTSTWMEQLWGNFLLLGGESFSAFHSKRDCSDGVLHIPEQSQLSTTHNKRINATWFIPCHAPPDIDHLPESYPGSSLLPLTSGSESNTCPDPTRLQPATKRPSTRASSSLCFRGVHDDFISLREIDQALRLGSSLIRSGGDHFDIHYNVDYLQESLPSIVKKLHTLLEREYHVPKVAPVAYRISAAGPMDGRGVPKVLKFDDDYDPSPSQQMVSIVNMTNYVDYMEHAQRLNGLSRFSLPWPFRIAPKRDQCMLMADLQADGRFAIHTSIFLSPGGGRYFSGGAMLYVDHHQSNSNPRRKIRRGLSIDGSRGRLVVSTGGLENRRCRLPIRSNIRAVLQIWWT